MKNVAVLAVFVLSLVGVAVTIDATSEEVRVERAFVLPAPEASDDALTAAATEELENRKRKKRDGGRGEEDEEELRLALHLLETGLVRASGSL